MRLPFGRRNAELETMNRILTDAARKRAERIKELEHQVAQLERQVAHLKQELEPAHKRASEFDVAATQRARLLNEKDEELAGVREVLTQRAVLLNEKDEELAGIREVLTERTRLLHEKVEEIVSLREALTKCSLRIQELENTLAEIGQK